VLTEGKNRKCGVCLRPWDWQRSSWSGLASGRARWKACRLANGATLPPNVPFFIHQPRRRLRRFEIRNSRFEINLESRIWNLESLIVHDYLADNENELRGYGMPVLAGRAPAGGRNHLSEGAQQIFVGRLLRTLSIFAEPLWSTSVTTANVSSLSTFGKLWI